MQGRGKSHKKFAEKYNLPLSLLADEDKKIAKAFGALGEKRMFGRVFEGVKRIAYLIDSEGKIAKVYPK